jgi:BarA-like signal transduction histidine kinase
MEPKMSKILRRKSDLPPVLEVVNEEEMPLPTPLPPQPTNDPPDPPSFDDLNGAVGISRKELKLPPVPGTYLNWEQWEAYAKSLTPDHWSHLDCYLYRYFPIIDQEPKYSDMVGEWKDWNYWVETHGGGKYGLVACDRALPKRQQIICSIRFEIDQYKYPPKLNYSSLELGDKRNRAYITKLVNQGILAPDSLEVIPLQPRVNDNTELVSKLLDKVTDLATDRNNQNNKSRDTNPIESQAASAAIKMVSDVSQKLMDRQAVANDPNTTIDTLTKLVTLVTPKADNSTMEMMKFMMESQAKTTQIMLDLNKSANERMEKLIEKMDSRSNSNNNGGGGSDMDKLDTFLTIAERLGGGGSQSTLQTIVGAAKEIAPIFVGPLVNMLMAKQAGAGYPVGTTPSNAPQIPPGFDPNAGVPPIMPNPSNSPNPTPSPSINGVTKEQIAGFFSQFGSNITQAMERGDTGAELAQSLETLAGYEKYLQIRAIVEDRALVLEGASLVPQFFMVIKGHGLDKFQSFIDSFCEWATLREQPDVAESGEIN